jgi:hypothetical protein
MVTRVDAKVFVLEMNHDQFGFNTTTLLNSTPSPRTL